MSALSSLEAVLGERLRTVFAELGYPEDLAEVQKAQRPELADFQCNAAFNLAGRLSLPPLEVAVTIERSFNALHGIATASVAPPGFVNLSLDEDYLVERVQGQVEDGRMGVAGVEQNRPVVIDFGGPNVAKSMHVGHLRSSIIGDCLQRLFHYVGSAVISDVHMGDWGIQMGMLLIEAQRRWPELPYFEEGRTDGFPLEPSLTIDELNAMYPIVAARCKEDADELERARAATAELQAGRPGYRVLWRQFVEVTIKSLRADFDTLDVHFDLWLGESDANDCVDSVIESLQREGLLVQSDGALVVPLGEELPPLVVRKSDGSSLYATTDLATLEHRVKDLGADTILYVVDERQQLYFKQLFATAHKWSVTREAQVEHIAFGTVNGSDGRPFRTRSGDVIQLRVLLDSATEHAARHMEELGLGEELPAAERTALAPLIGLGAIRYADLMHHRTSSYKFDIDRFTAFEGNTGPYLQYAIVRIASILRRAADANIDAGPLLLPTPAERELYLLVTTFGGVVEQTLEQRAPHLLCHYAFELAQAFNRQSPHVNVLHESESERQASRVTLFAAIHRILGDIANMLGVPIPARM